jgi:multiple sugar transport system permease protein
VTAGSLADARPVAAARRGWRIPWRILLATFAVLPFVVPFLWLVASALKPLDQFYASPPTLLPNPPSLDNLAGVARLLETPRLLANSTVIAVLSTGMTVMSSAVVGYAFATLQARGRRLLFAILLATIMIPQAATIVPEFILFSRLGWVGTWLPLLVPPLFGSAFYIFLFRQWFLTIPSHVLESAELDGATPFQTFRHIALPLAIPAIAAVAVFAFLASWNDFLAPLVYLRSPDSFTVSVGMATLEGVYVNQLHYSVAMALIVLVPPICVFLLAQRFLVGGITRTGWRA